MNDNNYIVNFLDKTYSVCVGWSDFYLVDIEKLLDKYSINEIDEVLDSIENFKGNKKYTSLYLTANKWLSKNKKSTEVEEPKELLLARKLGLC